MKDKRVIVAVTGSVAAYKAVDLASKLTQSGALVTVVMTESAQRFVTPAVFQAVTGRPVYTDLWQTVPTGELSTHIPHVGLAKEADLLIIAPATAHTIAKLKIGLADNLVTTLALVATCPILIAPAMESAMYRHITTQKNIHDLKERGVLFIEPQSGHLASRADGVGRLPETPELMGHIRAVLGKDGLLKGKKIVVTAGGTQEAIDPVRILTNLSSGKQGYAIAQAAIDQGAQVTLISGPSVLQPPIGCAFIPIHTASEMTKAVLKESAGADSLIMAAAVADYRPLEMRPQKIKKINSENITLELTPNPDILALVQERKVKTKSPKIIVGFAAETNHLLENAQKKLKAKSLDLIVANDITQTDAGFGVDTNRVTLIDKTGTQEQLPIMTKYQVGEIIIQKILEKLR